MQSIRLQAYKSSRQPHMSWDATLLAQSGEWILTYSPLGTEVQHHTRDLSYYMQHKSIGIFSTKEFYNLFLDLNADGSFKMLYSNVATPAVMADGVITWTDLELDVVRRAGMAAELVDQDEFEAAKRDGLLLPKLADKAEAVAIALLKAVNDGDFPFLAGNDEQVIRTLEQRFQVKLGKL